MMTSNCPDDERIRQALEEGSQDEEFFGHLEGCASCRARVEKRFDDDVLVGAFGPGGRAHGNENEPAEDPRELAGFEIVREIRRGGQGVVYEARDPGTGRRVALKTIHRSAHASEQKRARFEREITLTAGLDHSGIVRLYQSGQTAEGTQYFAMEYVEGQDLTDLLRQEGPVKTDSQAKQRLQLFVQICDAIAHAHSRGVMHRDLKPSNIRIDVAGEPRVLDFGLAKQLDAEVSDELTRSIEFVGTMVWAAPEQTPLVKASVGPWTDVYTLGHLLHHLFTCKHPHSTEGGMLEVLARVAHSKPELPGRSLVGLSISRDLDAIIRRALEKEPQDRYISVIELREDCCALLEGRPVSARNSGTFVLAVKLVRRHPMWTAMAAAALAGIIFVGQSLRREVHALERAAAMSDLENISRVGKLRSAAKSHEEAAWRLLLGGGAGLDYQLPDLEAFPGPAGMLDKMRGAYVSMPVTGTYGGSVRSLVGVPGRAEFVAIANHADGSERLNVVQLPALQTTEFDLQLSNVTHLRLSPAADEIYFLSDGRAYVQRYPIIGGEQPVPVDEWATAPAWVSSASYPPTIGYVPRLIPASFVQAGAMDVAVAEESELPNYLTVYSTKSFSVRRGIEPATIRVSTPEGWVTVGEKQYRFGTLNYWNGDLLPVVDSDQYASFPAGFAFDWGKVEFQEKDRLLGSLSQSGRPQGEVGVFFSGRGYGVNVRANPRENMTETRAVHGHGSKISYLLMESNGEHFLSRDRDQVLRCWDVNRVLKGWLHPLPVNGGPQSVHAIAESDTFLVRGGVTSFRDRIGKEDKRKLKAGHLDVLSLRNGQMSSRMFGDKRVSGVGFIGGSDDKLLIARDGAEILLLDLGDSNSVARPLARPDCPPGDRSARFNHLAVDASGTRVALPTNTGSVHLLEFEAGGTGLIRDDIVTVPGELGSPRWGRLPAVAWHPDGSQLVVAHVSGELAWIRAGKTVSVAKFHSEPVRTVAASPDGKWVAAAGEDFLVSLWHWGAAEPEYSLVSRHQANIYALAFDEHSRRLASADAAGVVLVWDVATWDHGPAQLLYVLETKSSIVLALHFLRYGNSEQLLVGGDARLGTLAFDPKDLDPFVAGNFAHFASELKDAASPAVVKKMRRWSQEVLAR